MGRCWCWGLSSTGWGRSTHPASTPALHGGHAGPPALQGCQRCCLQPPPRRAGLHAPALPREVRQLRQGCGAPLLAGQRPSGAATGACAPPAPVPAPRHCSAGDWALLAQGRAVPRCLLPLLSLTGRLEAPTRLLLPATLADEHLPRLKTWQRRRKGSLAEPSGAAGRAPGPRWHCNCPAPPGGQAAATGAAALRPSCLLAGAAAAGAAALCPGNLLATAGAPQHPLPGLTDAASCLSEVRAPLAVPQPLAAQWAAATWAIRSQQQRASQQPRHPALLLEA